MRVMKIPVQNSSQGARLVKMRADTDSALVDFCHQQLLKSKLAGPTFSYRFNLVPRSNTTASRSEIKKGLVRLKELFRRDLEKSIPYIEYAREPLLNIRGRQTYSITLVSWAENLGISFYQYQRLSGSGRRDLVKQSSYGRVLERYKRYLQYLCLKYGAPFMLTIDFDFKLSDASQLECQGLQTQEQQAEYKPEFHYVCRINIDPTYWTPREVYGANGRAGTAERSIENWIKTNLKNHGSAQTYHVDRWVSHYIANGRPAQTTDITDLGRYWVAERIFLFIDPIRKILKSLSRKTSYVPSAFSIRAAEGS
jgi:hypothetical protein